MLVAFAAFLGLGFLAFTALNIEAYPDPARNGLPRSQAVLSVATTIFMDVNADKCLLRGT